MNTVNSNIQQTMTRRIQDERELLHALLVDPRHTTAETGLVPDDFCEPAHVEIWRAISELEDSMKPRELTDVVRVLKRWGKYNRRLMRQVLESDPSLTLTHWAWSCAELRERAVESRKIRSAFECLERYTQ